MRIARRLVGSLAVAVVAAAVWISWQSSDGRAVPDLPGTARLVAFESVPDMAGESCDWEVATLQRSSYMQGPNAVGGRAPGALDAAERAPLRFIQDPYASFTGVRVDTARNEVLLLDANHFNLMVFDRLTNTPATATHSEPKRSIGGEKTRSQYASDAYIDPANGDIYAINNDSLVGMNVFSSTQSGDVPPARALVSPYGAYGIMVDEEAQELYLAIQHDGAIATWRKNASGRELPIRLLQGPATRLADPHGIALDRKNKLLYTVNFGTSRIAAPGVNGRQAGPGPRDRNWPAGNYSFYRFEVQYGTGKFEAPSIVVHRAASEGNVAPVRVIQGPKTQLNWPTGIAIDEQRNEIYIANDIGDSIVVFDATAEGDVAPKRVIKGPRTQIKHPTGVFVDVENQELWVANFGNHRATAYRLNASGNAAPIRVIRSAPDSEPTTALSNPFSISYDPSREEILVPNCVGHPRIAAFSRLADKNAAPTRTIQGQKTLLNRTVHSITYDEVHDEIVVNQNIGQAILTFRGAADGEEAPIRIIQGPRTQLRDPEKLAVDPINNEIFVMNMTMPDRVLVFDRTANGDVAPKRVLMGPDTMLGASQVAVDPVHNLLIVGGNVRGQGTRLLIFDRTAEGNTKPKAVIGGPTSGLQGISGHGLRVYPPTGKILVNVRGAGGDEGIGGAFTGIWSIDDNGDVPPQWTLGKGMLQQSRGLTVDAANKVVIIADKQLQGVLTYSLPEMFEPSPRRQTAQVRP